MFKYCYKCKNTLEVNEFHKDISRKDGYSNSCKICNKAKVYLWRKKKREKKLENV